MTWIRIDPNEMETASRELQSCSTTVGDTVAGLQAQSGALPATVSAQVATTLATLERQLHDIRVEILLEATILALRGILALKGSPVAGTMSMEVPAPTTGFVGGNLIANPVAGFVGGGLITSGITSGSSGMATIGGAFAGAVPATGLNPGGLGIIGGNAGPGFTITNADGTPAGPGFYSTSAIITAPTNRQRLRHGLDPPHRHERGNMPVREPLHPARGQRLPHLGQLPDQGLRRRRRGQRHGRQPRELRPGVRRQGPFHQAAELLSRPPRTPLC